MNFGEGELDGTDYKASTILGDNSGVSISIDLDGPSDPDPKLAVDELSATLAPGTYTAVSSCSDHAVHPRPVGPSGQRGERTPQLRGLIASGLPRHACRPAPCGRLDRDGGMEGSQAGSGLL